MIRASMRCKQSLRPEPLTLTLALVTLLMLGTGVTTTPAAADWLVMTDGARVETDGHWTERGKVVVFTNTSGTLVSLRLSEVDLDASRALTTDMAETASQPAPAPPPPRPSVFRLTDDDVEHIDDEDVEAPEADESTGEPADTPLIGVIAWERDDTAAGDGLEVRATLENQGEDVAVNIVVNVTVYDDTGEVLATSSGQLAANGLVPGQTTEMVATFPGIFDFTAVDFDVQHRSIRTRPLDEAPDLGEDFGTES